MVQLGECFFLVERHPNESSMVARPFLEEASAPKSPRREVIPCRDRESFRSHSSVGVFSVDGPRDARPTVFMRPFLSDRQGRSISSPAKDLSMSYFSDTA